MIFSGPVIRVPSNVEKTMAEKFQDTGTPFARFKLYCRKKGVKLDSKQDLAARKYFNGKAMLLDNVRNTSHYLKLQIENFEKHA